MRYVTTDITGADEQATLDRLWAESQHADDRGFRPRGGWWPLSAWAGSAALLLADGAPVGGVALNTAPDGALEARLALLPAHRTAQAARWGDALAARPGALCRRQLVLSIVGRREPGPHHCGPGVADCGADRRAGEGEPVRPLTTLKRQPETTRLH